MSKWLEAIQEVAFQNPKLNEAMCDLLNRGLADLQAVTEYLEDQS
jgi:hypothetical protein